MFEFNVLNTSHVFWMLQSLPQVCIFFKNSSEPLSLLEVHVLKIIGPIVLLCEVLIRSVNLVTSFAYLLSIWSFTLNFNDHRVAMIKEKVWIVKCRVIICKQLLILWKMPGCPFCLILRPIERSLTSWCWAAQPYECRRAERAHPIPERKGMCCRPAS